MNNQQFRTKNFLKLKDQWYKKLAKSGFEDIENTSLPDPDLKHCDVIRFNKVTPDAYETRTKYFSNCRDLLNTYKFETKLHKRIWELHSEGLSLREIETVIKKRYKKDSIHNIIRKISLRGMP